MGVIQWIVEDKGVLTTRVKVSPRLERLLAETHALLTWEEDYPGALPQEPGIDVLERVAAIALLEIASYPDPTLNRVDALIERLSRFDEDNAPDGYPEDAPDGQAFVLGAYAIFCLDQAIGHYVNGEHPEALDAMADMGDALHAFGFERGTEIGLAHGHRANSSKGGRARNAKYRQLELWAIDLYKTRNWKSAHQASHELKDDVLARAKTLGLELSPYRAQQTIYGWLLAADKPTTKEAES